MPIHEFNCTKCDYIFEELVFNSNTPPCPKCSSSTIKLLSKPTLHYQAPSRVGQTVTFPKAKNSCAGCSATSCGSCK